LAHFLQRVRKRVRMMVGIEPGQPVKRGKDDLDGASAAGHALTIGLLDSATTRGRPRE